MKSDREIRTGVRRLLRLPLRTHQEIDADADAELAAFLAERIEHLTAAGLSPDDARAEAVRRLGSSLPQATELLHHSARTRERRMGLRELFDDLRQDFRYALRTLRRDARFTLLTTIIVGLGIGASVTVFSVLNALLLRPLPFQEPGRLAWIENNTGTDGLSGHTTQVQHLLDVTKEAKSFAGIAAYFAFYKPFNSKFTSQNETIQLTSVPVTQSFFDVLGVRPLLGRNFNAEESSTTQSRAVLLSHALWTQRFAADPGVIGRAIRLDNGPVTVIGVLPATFDFGSVFAPGLRVDAFIPFPLNESTNQWGNTLSIIGRLKPNVEVKSSQAEIQVIAARIMAANPKRNKFEPTVTSLRQHVSGGVRPALIVLSLSVLVVMLIVCANLSNLLLARATTRHKEMAIRIALGAGRQRLVRQTLTESMVLSLFGGALGISMAVVGTRVISGLSGLTLPLLDNVRVDGAALAFAGVLAVVVGFAFGIVPALQIPASQAHGALKEAGRDAGGGNRARFIRKSLVVSEIALACMLLVGAGLLTRSFLKVLDVDMGFKPEMLASMRVNPAATDVVSSARFISYVDDVLRRAKEVPGVVSAGITDGLPLEGNRTWGVAAKSGGYPQAEWPEAFVHVVSDGYFSTMGIRLVAGRDFSVHDTPVSDSVIIVNESVARTLWPQQDAIGKLMRSDRERRVIGVVGDVRHLSPERGAGMEIYLPIRQTGDFSSVELVVRSNANPSLLAPAIREALRPVAPNLPTNQFKSVQQTLDVAVSPRRFMTTLLAGFAAFALLLALLGIYGVISYTVNQRTQEIGVRMALGASAGQLQSRIVRETLTLAATGMAIGTLGSWVLARTLGNFLFGVTSTDPLTFVGMLLILTTVAAVSGYIPARRASRIDPITALRGG